MERTLLIGVAEDNRQRWQKIDSLEELQALVKTAGGEVVEKILQIRDRPDPATFLGKGKIDELKQLCEKHKIDLLVFDEPLSATQIRNISQITNTRVIDRTALILDIFAQHAKTAEAKTQVELAQLEYRRSNLVGLGVELSRLGGGIGTRGPGEKKLEVDRRRIRERIAILKRILAKIDKERLVQRKLRQPFFKISLVGYTNAGKSTLMNRLTNANVKVSPELFATLDSNTKPLILAKNIMVFVTDTVGFIRNLPHELVASFRSTLGEIRNADLILQVVDASEDDIEQKIKAVEDTLAEIGCQEKPKLMVFNKIDRVFESNIIKRFKNNYPGSIFISALNNEGIDKLKSAILRFVNRQLTTKTFTIPITRGDLINRIYNIGSVVRTIQNDTNITLSVKGYRSILQKLSKEIKNFKIKPSSSIAAK
ncbi:MAG: GTPase HflX [candidate division WOR-3 bacterium]